MEPFAFTTFCDDIRREDSGKLILVGVYTDVMGVPSFPTLLPTFATIVTAVIPYGSGDVDRYQVRLLLPDEDWDTATFRHDAEIAAEARDKLKSPAEDLEPKVLQVRAVSHFSPLQIERPGLIRARVKIGDRLVRAGSLRVTLISSLPEEIRGPSQA